MSINIAASVARPAERRQSTIAAEIKGALLSEEEGSTVGIGNRTQLSGAMRRSRSTPLETQFVGRLGNGSERKARLANPSGQRKEPPSSTQMNLAGGYRSAKQWCDTPRCGPKCFICGRRTCKPNSPGLRCQQASDLQSVPREVSMTSTWAAMAGFASHRRPNCGFGFIGNQGRG